MFIIVPKCDAPCAVQVNSNDRGAGLASQRPARLR